DPVRVGVPRRLDHRQHAQDPGGALEGVLARHVLGRELARDLSRLILMNQEQVRELGDKRLPAEFLRQRDEVTEFHRMSAQLIIMARWGAGGDVIGYAMPHEMLSPVIYAMAALRAAIGVAPFVAAGPVSRLLGFPAAQDTPTSRLMGRLFGVRDVALGAL